MLSLFDTDFGIADALWLIAIVLFVVGTVTAVMAKSITAAVTAAGLAFGFAGLLFLTP